MMNNHSAHTQSSLLNNNNKNRKTMSLEPVDRWATATLSPISSPRQRRPMLMRTRSVSPKNSFSSLDTLRTDSAPKMPARRGSHVRPVLSRNERPLSRVAMEVEEYPPSMIICTAHSMERRCSSISMLSLDCLEDDQDLFFDNEQ